ncbi:hypothetical protein [Crassaminicella indica]|uniref:Uncharacterized protein n=1 Tax=Crassaminicella indica TaxID=2855394 RepID=A0ABX8R8A1_9CLOT|nr:hypothetical protein [Crassaminicella indica]QXM05262.1 hypothetical protein KVH43_07605 [Crassaminicella indica]
MKKRNLVALIMILVLLVPLAVPLTVYATTRDDVKIKAVKENSVWRQKLIFSVSFTPL